MIKKILRLLKSVREYKKYAIIAPIIVGFEVMLEVTDKSKLTVNGKGNSGTINIPQERHYVVEIDSVSMGIIRKDDVK